MDCAGNCSTVEPGNALSGHKAAHNTEGITEHASLGAIVLQNHSCHLEGVREEDASEGVSNGDGRVRLAKEGGNETGAHKDVAGEGRNETEGEHAASSNLRDDLLVALGLAVVKGLLVDLKNAEGVAEDGQHDSSECASAGAGELALDVGSEVANEEAAEEATVEAALLIESSELLGNALGTLLGDGGLQNAVGLDNVERVGQHRVHL